MRVVEVVNVSLQEILESSKIQTVNHMQLGDSRILGAACGSTSGIKIDKSRRRTPILSESPGEPDAPSNCSDHQRQQQSDDAEPRSTGYREVTSVSTHQRNVISSGEEHYYLGANSETSSEMLGKRRRPILSTVNGAD